MCFEKKTGGDFVLEPRKEGDRQIRILIIKDKRGEVCVCVCGGGGPSFKQFKLRIDKTYRQASLQSLSREITPVYPSS